MASSLASQWLSAYLSASLPNAREPRISLQQPLPVVSIRTWSLPLELLVCWVFYQILCLVLMKILEKRKELGLKWGRVFRFHIDVVPQGVSQLSTTVTIYQRASACKEKKLIQAPNFRGAKPWSTGLCWFRSMGRLYFTAQARGRRNEPVPWWVREWLGSHSSFRGVLPLASSPQSFL